MARLIDLDMAEFLSTPDLCAALETLNTVILRRLRATACSSPVEGFLNPLPPDPHAVLDTRLMRRFAQNNGYSLNSFDRALDSVLRAARSYGASLAEGCPSFHNGTRNGYLIPFRFLSPDSLRREIAIMRSPKGKNLAWQYLQHLQIVPATDPLP